MTSIRLLVLAAVLCTLSMSLAAQTWDETTDGGGDAGDQVATVQAVVGSGPLTDITGDNPAVGDRDLYLIRIANPSAFSATTDLNPGTNVDTQLWLFSTTGVGIAFNDDINTSNYRSTFPVGDPLYNALTPGDYILGVSPWYNQAQSSAGQMFPTAYGTVAGPTGFGGGTNTLNGWVVSQSEMGTYRVTLTGCEFVSPPSVADMEVERATMLISDGGTDALNDVSVGGQTFTYTINNVGSGDLDLTGTPLVDVTPGTGAPTVSVTVQPNTPVVPAGMTTFEIQVTPSLGAFDFAVSIANNDPAKDPYDFTVTGNGFNPNLPAESSPSPGSAFTGPTNGPFTMSIDPGATLANAEIMLTDPENDDVSLLSVTETSAVAVTGIVAPTAPSGPVTPPAVIIFSGTADATNDPGSYTWEVVFEDADNGTDVTITVEIVINDLPPEHAIEDATGGNGTAMDPYTATFTQGDDGSMSIDMASVSDPNTSQLVNLVGTTPGGSNPAGGAGLSVSLGGGFITVTPAGTLLDADRGTHTFDVEVSDGTNSVIIALEVEVVGIAPTFTSTPVTSATPGQTYTYTATADGNPAPTLSVTSALPAWLTFNAGTGVLSGQPTKSDENSTVNVTLGASNGVAPDATQTFTINVGSAPSSDKDDDDSGCSAGGGLPTWPLLLVGAGLGAALLLRRRTA